MRDRFHVAIASAALSCFVACGRSETNTEAPVSSTPAQATPAATGGTGAAAGSTAAGAGRPATASGTATAGRGATSVATAGSGAAATGSAAPSAPDKSVPTASAGAGGAAAAAAAAGSAAPTGPMTMAMQEPPPLVCDDKDRTAEPKPVMATNMGSAPSGPFKVTIQTDPGLTTHTIYRPEFGEKKLPVIAWGNGGCIKDGLSFSEFLTEIASHGFLIVADGIPNGQGGGDITTDGTALIQALDWAYKENDRPCSPYYRKLDTSHIAAMGQSCGGLMTLGVSGDKRLTSVVISKPLA